MILSKKRIRDIKNNKSQFLTIFLMIFLGMLVYSGIRLYIVEMENVMNKYYAENNFADLWISGENFTESDLEEIKKTENVNNAERKLTIRANMVSDNKAQLEVNFIESNNICKFYVEDGEEFDADKSGVWLDSYFAENNDIKVGDSIEINYKDYTLKEKVLGLILIPDHIYDIKSEAEIFPTHEDYGFVYLSIKENPFSYDIFNYVLVDINDTGKIQETKNLLETKIESIAAVTDKDDLLSHSVYQGEIEEGDTYVGIFSVMFILIAILSVITTMRRIVKNKEWR